MCLVHIWHVPTCHWMECPCQRGRILAVYLHQDWQIPLQSVMIESVNLQLAIFGLSDYIYILFIYIYIHTFPHTLQRPGPKHLTLRKGSPSGRVARSRPSGWKPMAGLQWRSANQGKTSFAAWHSADALKTHPRHWWQHATSEKIPYSRIFCFNKD